MTQSSKSVAAGAREIARHRSFPFLQRLRFQALIVALVQSLALAVAVAVEFPLAPIGFSGLWQGQGFTTMLLGFAATVAGLFLSRQLVVYPGVRQAPVSVFATLFVYAALMVVMFGLRIEYSRFILTTVMASGLTTLLLIYWLYDRRRIPVLALVPEGHSRDLIDLAGAEWTILSSPADRLQGADAVVADLHADLSPAWERFIAQCVLAGIQVHDVKGVRESLTGRVEVEHLAENSFGSVLPSRLYLLVKRIGDVAAAVLVLPLVALIILLAAVAIKLESRGPVFFTQPRMGFRAHPFRIYKLRSMSASAPETGERFTSADDPRITAVGRFIRKYRIDELPQIFNILRGEMSWIGPRPEALELAEWYFREIPFYIYRHAVRPGISGWAQVQQGNVAEVEAATIKLQYDFFYIKNYSLWLDVLVVLRTLATIVTGFGSR